MSEDRILFEDREASRAGFLLQQEGVFVFDGKGGFLRPKRYLQKFKG